MVDLDFTGLNIIAPQGAQRAAARDFEQLPDNDAAQGNKSESSRKAAETEKNNFHRLQREADQNTDDRARAAAVYAEYQQNIRNGGQLVNEIVKGIQSGADIYDLFLKAMQVIGLYTSDRSLYDSSREMLLSVYGDALKQPQPLRLELDDVNDRLQKLQTAADTCTDADSRERIQRAIRAHRSRADELTAAIKRE